MPLPAVLLAGGLWTTISAFIGKLIGPLIGRILLFLGLSVATFTGLHAVINLLEVLIGDALGSLPADVLSILGIMKVDIALSTIVSAWGIKVLREGFKAASDVKNYIT